MIFSYLQRENNRRRCPPLQKKFRALMQPRHRCAQILVRPQLHGIQQKKRKEGEFGDPIETRQMLLLLAALCVLRWALGVNCPWQRAADGQHRLFERRRNTPTTAAAAAQTQRRSRSSVALSVNDCSWFTAFFPTSGERTPVGGETEREREREGGGD